MRIPWSVPRASLVALLATACDYTRYEMHMEPHGAGFERSLRVVTISPATAERPERVRASGVESGTAQRLAQLYGAQEFPPEATLTAWFEGVVPADHGGAGRLVRLETPFGSLVHYQERAGGDDDLGAFLHRAREAGRLLAELGRLWLDHELHAHPAWAEGAAAFEELLARDLANLIVTYVLDQGFRRSVQPSPPERSTARLEATAARLAMYCIERGYLELPDVPVLLRAAADWEAGAPLGPLVRLAARALGHGDPD